MPKNLKPHFDWGGQAPSLPDYALALNKLTASFDAEFKFNML